MKHHQYLARGCIAAVLLGLTACSQQATTAVAWERIAPAPLLLDVPAEGILEAQKSVPLMVPGRQFTPRQLVWTVPDGSRVKKGEVVARFSATESEQDLQQALVDLERNLLARAGKQAELASTRGQLGVDLSDVATQLAIARRYANAGLAALARNKVLDAVQDEHFLETKKGILDWREDESGVRGKAELAVLDAQRATLKIGADQKRADLDALELRAPHAGMFVLQADWSGQKPQIGAQLWGGMPMASLPDTQAMEVTLAVPQIEAHGIKVGDAVRLHPLGIPGEQITAKLTWVAQAAQAQSSDSPVKYLSMKAAVPADAITRWGWVPGQRFAGDVVLLDAAATISVPNLAITSAGGHATVQVRGEATPRAVTLGVRGAARSQVLRGLRAGDIVLLDRAAGRAP